MSVQATLVYTDQNGAKQSLPLVSGEDTTIGRHPNCSLTISQPSVSRRHARLWFDQGAWYVEDLQSSNGTYVNDKRINRTNLADGDELRCGDFLLVYGIDEKTRAVPTNERRERQASVPSPQVSNRATIGLESPPPIPEAPRLGSPQPVVAPPSAPAAPAAPVAPFANAPMRSNQAQPAPDERLQEELTKSQSEVESLRMEIGNLEKQLRTSEEELRTNRQQVAQLNDELTQAQQAQSAAANELEKAAELRAQLESELGEQSIQNRTLRAEKTELLEEIQSMKASASEANSAEADAEKERLESEVARLADELDKKRVEIEGLVHSTQMVSSAKDEPDAARESTQVQPNFDVEALASQTSELRVALKAASGFVVEVKEVFTALSALKPGTKPAKSVTDLQDIFDENGGLDPVTSLEVAFQRMEQTARDLRRLSKTV